MEHERDHEQDLLQYCHKLYRRITKRLLEKEQTITTMESCTSGLIASLITDTEGSSAALKGAFITYSNASKIDAGVPAAVIVKYGVYSLQTAKNMALACREKQKADFGVGVTGTFGNADPNNSDSVPGTVYAAICHGEEVWSGELHVGEWAKKRGTDEPPTRFEYKLFTAAAVGEQLLEILNR